LNYIFVGCDSHDKTLVTKIAINLEASEKKTFSATGSGRRKFIQYLAERAKGGAKVVVAYEASGNGFILCDELRAAGFDCHVLAPTKIERSTKQKRNKNDDRDADRLLEILRGHYLAGNRLPSVWVPDVQTRDDRETVRTRQDMSQKATAVKTQIQMLLKRNGKEKPEGIGKGWSKSYRQWLKGLAESGRERLGMRTALGSLLRQLEFLEDEIERLDQAMQQLADSPRWKPITEALMKEKGVGLNTALKFATDIADFSRFRRGRQIGAYYGLVPSSRESGENNDRKGHITREGSPSTRQILCQSTWARVRHDEKEREVYRRLTARNPKKKKVALVACMRLLSVRLWHVGLQAQLKMKMEG